MLCGGKCRYGMYFVGFSNQEDSDRHFNKILQTLFYLHTMKDRNMALGYALLSKLTTAAWMQQRQIEMIAIFGSYVLLKGKLR